MDPLLQTSSASEVKLLHLHHHLLSICEAERESTLRHSSILQSLNEFEEKVAALSMKAEKLNLEKESYVKTLVHNFPLWLSKKTENASEAHRTTRSGIQNATRKSHCLNSLFLQSVNPFSCQETTEKLGIKISTANKDYTEMSKENHGISFVTDRTTDESRSQLPTVIPSKLFPENNSTSLNKSSKLSVNPTVDPIATLSPTFTNQNFSFHRRYSVPNAENIRTDLLQNNNFLLHEKLSASHVKIRSTDLEIPIRLEVQQPVKEETASPTGESSKRNSNDLKKDGSLNLTTEQIPSKKFAEKQLDVEAEMEINWENNPSSLGNTPKDNGNNVQMRDDSTDDAKGAETPNKSEERQNVQTENINDETETSVKETKALSKDFLQNFNVVDQELPNIDEQNFVMEAKPSSTLSSESEDSFFDKKIEAAPAYKNFFKNLDAELRKEESSSDGIEKEMTEIIDDKMRESSVKEETTVDPTSLDTSLKRINQDTSLRTKFQPSAKQKKNFLATLNLDSDTDSDVGAEAKANSSDEFSFYS